MEAAIPLGTRLRNIGQRRAVLARLIGSDLRVKYEGSVLGYLWSVLEPLLLSSVYFVVFSMIGRFRSVDRYMLFLVAGVLPWRWVTTTITGSMRALRANAGLITKVYLPREIFPLSVVGSKTIEFLLSQLVLIPVALAYRDAPSVYLVALPLAVLLQFVLLTGVALTLSAANTLLRDVERLVSPVVRSLFYLSPILYPVSLLFESGAPRAVKVLYQLNPMVGILELHRAVWYPERFQGWDTVGVAAFGALLILVVGWLLFTRLERTILKEL